MKSHLKSTNVKNISVISVVLGVFLSCVFVELAALVWDKAGEGRSQNYPAVLPWARLPDVDPSHTVLLQYWVSFESLKLSFLCSHDFLSFLVQDNKSKTGRTTWVGTMSPTSAGHSKAHSCSTFDTHTDTTEALFPFTVRDNVMV